MNFTRLYCVQDVENGYHITSECDLFDSSGNHNKSHYLVLLLLFCYFFTNECTIMELFTFY